MSAERLLTIYVEKGKIWLKHLKGSAALDVFVVTIGAVVDLNSAAVMNRLTTLNGR